MIEFELTIGDKQLSSWSLRPWLALKQTGIPFVERTVRLDRPETKSEILKQSPSGLVPSLRHGDLVIWDSLAILEHVAEQKPSAGLWPDDYRKRAIARSMAAEMHSGFGALRQHWPMQFATRGVVKAPTEAVAKDIARIDALLSEPLNAQGRGGDFLFGAFSIADAMFAPVASRFTTYGATGLSPAVARWVEMMMALPAMQSWGRGAEAERAERAG
jgi:glutathione S-transferase